MAESTLTVDYTTLQREVATFSGWPRDSADWTSTHTADFGYLLARGLRWAYFPPTPEGQPRFEWSFMRKTGTLTLLTSTASYTLPDDFHGVIIDNSLVWAMGANKRSLQKIGEELIRKQQAMSDTNGAPKYFAVRPAAHAPTTGQRWDLLVFPTPTAEENNLALTYRYNYMPDTLTSGNKYPVGGSAFSEVVLSAVLASAELMLDDEANGTMQQQFQANLQAAIRSDAEKKSNARSPGA